MRLFVLAFAFLLAQGASAYLVSLDHASNRAGELIFNSSLGHGWTYSLDTNRTPKHVRKLISVGHLDGQVHLKRTLTCDESQPNPVVFYVECRSFKLGGSSTEYVGMPVMVKFCGKLPHPGRHLSTLVAVAVTDRAQKTKLPQNEVEELSCHERSQWILNVKQLLPGSVSKCRVIYDLPSDPNYALEPSGGDLVAKRDFCVPYGQWLVQVPFSVRCHERPVYEQSLELLFHLPNVNADVSPERSSKSRRRRRGRREMRNLPPYFDRAVYVVAVPEEKEKGHVVTTVSAKDPNNDELRYSLHAVLDARSQSMFTIDPHTGLVTTAAILDREFMDVHYLRVTAVDNGSPSKSGTTTLQVNVADENDHTPSFERATYETSVRESVAIGTTILTVRATDQDTGGNAEIEYSILNPSGSNDVFRIDPKTGILTTRSFLDRETTSFYSLLVQATDLGPVADRRSATTTVEVTVLDDNDNYPQFTERSYTATVPEDINWLTNPMVAAVKAYDDDSGINAALRYSLIGGNTQGHFVMDSLTGEVTLVKPLDYETARSYRLVVRAQDGGSPSRSNTTQVLVKVTDVNDNDPKFYTSLFQESVMENVPVGQSIVRVQAYDADDGPNAEVTYSIQTRHPDMPLDVDRETGWIVTTRELDREQGSLYDFSVVASDRGPMPRSATASVIIRVQDLNDNDPVFEPKIYEATISEVDPPGTPVVSVTATDKDENPRLVYHLTNGNVRGRFGVISQNGQGLLSVAQSLDFKMEKRFVLTVSATDAGGRFDTATVYVNVTDANTHRPVFERTPYAASVPEDAAVGTTVLVVEAVDEDVGENARLVYTMDEVPEFRMDPATGAIVTTRPLDRESSAGYTIVVTAQDNGNPPLSDTTNVEVEVSDVNDNPPEFQAASYTSAVSEDALVGTSVVQVVANDKDLGLNGQIRYTFSGGDDGSGAFSVDPTSGVIRTNRMLDREAVPIYNLIVYAVDRGAPAMSTSVSVVVYVEDINDNPPRFESDKIKLFVPENSPIGWTVGEVKAFDPDEGPNAEVQYSIVGGPDADAFSLVSRPGEPAELTTRVDMDYESPKKKYGVIVRASSPPLRNDVDVEIWVTDVNDNAPLLKDFTILFNNYKNYFPVGSIGRVPAFDADVTDNLRFRFVSGNNANLLLLNETSGEVTLSPSLNTNVPIHALMEVSVFDGINEVLAHCQLIVRLVTEAMLFNSVTVRLNDMTQTEFLSPLFDYFIEGLSVIIPCPKENIFVFNVQDDTDVEARILNVSFSARRLGSRDPDEFYSPQFLQERVYLNRAILAKLTNVQVLPFDDNLCVREPCVNFEECLSVLKFGNASGFISSDSLLFRPIYPVNTFACRCPLGFTGMNHKYECDTEVNLCYSSPCGTNGTCVRREGGYTCLCKEGFTGKNCEVSLWESHCPQGICQGGSRCSHLSDSSGFFCDNCTMSSWSTKLCELRARSFSRGTFLTFPSLKQRYRLHIKMRFATREKNALLLYNGRYNEKHDFFSLEIVDSQVVFSFSLGVNVTKVVATLAGGVSDGQWHQVEISYLNRTVILSVDNCDSALAIKYKRQLPNYSCANSTTFFLEQRCADLMQTCYRFLDLTGPLQVGGLPTLITEFQVQHQHFVGCIMDLEIDHQLIDLNSFVADNGTVAGCLEKRGFCQSNPCKNGGSCEEGWSSFICRCSIGFGGVDCSEDLWKKLDRGVEPAKHFLGNGFVILTPHLRPVQMPWINSLAFRTRQGNGLLMNIQLGQSSYALLELKDGYVEYRFDEQHVGIHETKVDDGKWHHIQAKWMGNEVWLSLDHGQYEVTKQMEGNIRGLYVGKVSIGGLEPTDTEEASSGFNGCMQNVQIGDTHSRESWLRPSVESNVKDGCHAVNPCLNSPCPTNSQCVDLWGAYKCQCNPGYVGEKCLPVCDLQPCKHEGICQRTDSKVDAHRRGYSCECDSLHSGEYCEFSIDQPCPSNWWGYPICGPCNCPVNKGYDADCNKTTGECVCEENHFQPLDSDICFDCDCYATGSFSNKCDTIMGQCRCRNGVIGRRCDACSSPFAEVTLRGCEVIYDGCPRSFEEGIWWDRTLFDHEAVHPCPRGAVGKSFRFCDKDGGWRDANLFNCTSEVLLELASQLGIMEKNNLPLSTYSAVKISADLHVALNGVDMLYGSDVLIISRFLHYILTYETKQDGLNLTHRQDRDFIQNIVDIASNVLEPQYIGHWEKIVGLTGLGPEYLMLLFEKYGGTLARNQGDTFTDPFEAVAKNMIFGMDTVSSNEMWTYFSDPNSNVSVAIAEPSDFLDLSLSKADGPGVMIPKYNNFPVRKIFVDDVTRIVFPLSNLHVGVGRGTMAPLQETRERAIISYAIYPSIGKLLPPFYDSSVRHRFGIPVQVNSPVINVVALPVNSSLLLKNQLLHNLRLRFRILQADTHTSPQCAFWDFANGPRGKWSTEGCEIQGFDYKSGRGSKPYVNCTCGHLTSFALLMDATDKDYLVEESLAQDIVSYLGILVSLIMLGLAFIALSILRGLQTNSNTIHKNLIACIFLAQLVFLVALKARHSLVKQEFPCKVVAIVLHYFFLSIFSWMLLEGIHLYRMLTEMRDINHGQMRFYYSIGYGAPAIVVGLSVGVRADQYGNYFFCWLSIYESVVWSLVGPICFVVVINLGVFAMAMKASIQIKGSVTDFGNLRILLWLAIILLPLLGTTWVLAVLSVNESLEILHFSFSVSCMIEGIYVFVGYCIINKKVRQQLVSTWARLRGKKLPYDESLSGTRTTVASRSALAYNNSSFDVLHRNVGISTSSTTSRSTKTSSSPYRSDSHLRNTSTSTSAQLNSGSEIKGRTRRRKAYLYRSQSRSKNNVDDPDTGEANQRKKGETDSDSEMSVDHASLDLASSHSSDDEEYEEGWKKKKLNTKPEMMSKPNIVEEAENSQAQLAQSYNVPPSTTPNLRVNIAPFPQYTGFWSVPPKLSTSSYVRDGTLKSLGQGLRVREDPKRSDLLVTTNHRNLPDISLPLQSRFSPPLIDDSPSPEQKLPVPERADSLPNNLHNRASQSQQRHPNDLQDETRATQLADQVMGQCMVIPPLTTTELSSESESETK